MIIAADSHFVINRRVLASSLKPSEKTLLIVILDYARHGKSSCTASNRTLGRESGFTGRSVFRIIGHLVAEGWLILERRTGSKHSSRTLSIGPACYGEAGIQQWDSYEAYLKSDVWKKRRRQALEADGFRCRICDSGMDLNVHHRSYDRLGSEAPMDLITLCRQCHAVFHGKNSAP